jgi:ribosomal protein L37AE/L43A
MPDEGEPDPRTWFDEDELERCPFCGAMAAIRNESQIGICLACEVVWIKDDEEPDGV